MRIVFLSQVLPLPLDAGPKIRSYYVLRHLVRAGHEVTLVSFVRPGDRHSDIQQLSRLCTAIETVPIERSRLTDVRHGIQSLLSPMPFLIRRDLVPAMHDRLRQVLQRGSVDAVHADQLWMAEYAASRQDAGTRVLDQHNAVFKVPRRLAQHQRNPVLKALLLNEASKLEAFERAALDRFHHVAWVSEEDLAAFPDARRPGGRTAHDVIPIAVDPSERQPMKRDGAFRVTFLGGTHWPPNGEGVRWFAEQIWPRVAAAVPDAVFTVIGKGSVGPLGERAGRGRIDVTGYLRDVEPHLRETAAFVVPLRTGAGMRVKILDAWSWGLPVVSTSVGAEGIRTSDGENLLLGDSAEDFANHVIRVLRDRTVARRLAEGGRSTVESLYDWRRVYQAWDQIYH